MTHRMRGVLYFGTILCLVSALLAGCGGGGGSSNSGLTPVKVTIAWAARGRTLNAPSSALSAVVTLKQAAANGADFSYTINRVADPAAYTQTYTSTTTAKTGSWPMTTQFYAQANGSGAVVGTATATVTIKSDGTGIGDIATSGAIASVALTPGQGVQIGKTTFLTFTAYDANNAVVAVSPETGFFTLVSGGKYLAINNGVVQGLALGGATVTVTVDGKTSAPATVSTQGITHGLEVVGHTALYGTARVRIRGLYDSKAQVSVAVGGVVSPSAAVAYTDNNAPSSTASSGGAIDFQVPVGLAYGSQNLVVTVNGGTMPPIPVNVSDPNPFAVFTLDSGSSFVAELRQDSAPKTVANFIGLATGTKTYTDPCTNLSSNAPLYNGTTFHRCIAGFVRQGGDPLSRCLAPNNAKIGTGQIGFTLPFEVTGLTHLDGALAMARSADLNSASSQFFIDDGPQPTLNPTYDASGKPTGGYVVFGKVVEGLSIAKGIKLTQDINGNSLNVTPTGLTSVIISGKLDGP